MSFKDKTFDQRFKDRMWDHSERAFETAWTGPKLRYGLDQTSDTFQTWKLSAHIRHAPDYLAQTHQNSEPLFIEVQGTGKDRLHKFKTAKLEALRFWTKEQDVWYWLWDNNLQTGTMISLQTIQLLIAKGLATKDMFDGKRPYWAIHVDTIATHQDWTQKRAKYG